MTREERAALTRASAEARAKTADVREAAEESARLGLKALLGRELEREAERVTERLRSLALSPDDSIALRGIELWLARVHGKAVQPTQDITPELPADVAALRAMTPEQRRELMRSLAAPVLPDLPQPAQGQG